MPTLTQLLLVTKSCFNLWQIMDIGQPKALVDNQKLGPSYPWDNHYIFRNSNTVCGLPLSHFQNGCDIITNLYTHTCWLRFFFFTFYLCNFSFVFVFVFVFFVFVFVFFCCCKLKMAIHFNSPQHYMQCCVHSQSGTKFSYTSRHLFYFGTSFIFPSFCSHRFQFLEFDQHFYAVVNIHESKCHFNIVCFKFLFWFPFYSKLLEFQQVLANLQMNTI